MYVELLAFHLYEAKKLICRKKNAYWNVIIKHKVGKYCVKGMLKLFMFLGCVIATLWIGQYKCYTNKHV